MLISLVAALVIVAVFGFSAMVMILRDVREYARGTHKAVMDVKRQVHTRQSRASMQSGATTDEQRLTRLGRASAARRVVVGGELDSQLYQDLDHSLNPTTQEGTDG